MELDEFVCVAGFVNGWWHLKLRSSTRTTDFASQFVQVRHKADTPAHEYKSDRLKHLFGQLIYSENAWLHARLRTSSLQRYRNNGAPDVPPTDEHRWSTSAAYRYPYFSWKQLACPREKLKRTIKDSLPTQTHHPHILLTHVRVISPDDPQRRQLNPCFRSPDNMWRWIISPMGCTTDLVTCSSVCCLPFYQYSLGKLLSLCVCISACIHVVWRYLTKRTVLETC